MKCSGKNALTGEWITVDTATGVAIQTVDPVLAPPEDSAETEYLAPGFIDGHALIAAISRALLAGVKTS